MKNYFKEETEQSKEVQEIKNQQDENIIVKDIHDFELGKLCDIVKIREKYLETVEKRGNENTPFIKQRSTYTGLDGLEGIDLTKTHKDYYAVVGDYVVCLTKKEFELEVYKNTVENENIIKKNIPGITKEKREKLLELRKEVIDKYQDEDREILNINRNLSEDAIHHQRRNLIITPKYYAEINNQLTRKQLREQFMKQKDNLVLQEVAMGFEQE